MKQEKDVYAKCSETIIHYRRNTCEKNQNTISNFPNKFGKSQMEPLNYILLHTLPKMWVLRKTLEDVGR